MPTTRTRNPIYLAIYEMRDKEQAHSPKCHTVTRDPRKYQGVCPEGDWTGTVTTGTKALEEMKAHAEATRVQAAGAAPAVDPELEALAAEAATEDAEEAPEAEGEGEVASFVTEVAQPKKRRR